MGQVLIRNIDDAVIFRLKAKAKAAGISLEELARTALREASHPSRQDLIVEIDKIRSRSTPTSFDSTTVIREMRDRGWHRD